MSSILENRKVVYGIFLICFIIILICMIYTSNKQNLSSIIQTSVEKSDLKTTNFEIYDNSSETLSDRLIFVNPLNFVLLNTNKQIYVIDPTTKVNCLENQTQAVKITKSDNTHQGVCLNFNHLSLISTYKKFPKTIIDYDLETSNGVFTIFTALNVLISKNLIQFEPSVAKFSYETIDSLKPTYSLLKESKSKHNSESRVAKALKKIKQRKNGIHLH